jgi:hypothetical protein
MNTKEAIKKVSTLVTRHWGIMSQMFDHEMMDALHIVIGAATKESIEEEWDEKCAICKHESNCIDIEADQSCWEPKEVVE